MTREPVFDVIKNRFTKTGQAIREFLLKHSRALQEKHRWARVLISAAGYFRKDNMSVHSGYFAYNAFMAIFALLLFLSAVLGFVLNSNPDLYTRIMKYIYDALPDLGTSFMAMLDSITSNRSLVSAIGLIALLWSGTRLFNAIAKGFGRIWPEKRQGFMARRLVAGLMILIIFLLFTASITVQYLSTSLISNLIEPGYEGYKFLYHLTTIALTMVTSIFLFFFIYLVIPSFRQRSDRVMKAATVSGVLFLIIQYVLNFYFAEISRTNVLYGVIGGVIGILIWLHLLGMVTFFGAELMKAMADEDKPVAR